MIDWLRIFYVGAGIALGVIVFVQHGVWFHVPDGLPEILITVCAIFSGFQMSLFSTLFGVNNTDFKNKILKTKANRAVNNKFLRQYVIFVLYLIVIVVTLMSLLTNDLYISDYFKRAAVALACTAFVWSAEIPRLILQLRDDQV
jgi:Ca2+/Na+ antiporter